MTRQAVVVRRKMDMPTAVVAMLGMASFSLPSEFTLGPSKGDERTIHEGSLSLRELLKVPPLEELLTVQKKRKKKRQHRLFSLPQKRKSAAFAFLM